MAIHVHAHPSPLRVSYVDVRKLIPSLLFPSSEFTQLAGKKTPNFDLVLFIGLAPKQEYFTLETQAHRDGYDQKNKDGKEKIDVDGKSMEGDQYWKKNARVEGGEGFEAPVIMGTSFECEEVLRRWKDTVGVCFDCPIFDNTSSISLRDRNTCSHFVLLHSLIHSLYRMSMSVFLRMQDTIFATLPISPVSQSIGDGILKEKDLSHSFMFLTELLIVI